MPSGIVIMTRNPSTSHLQRSKSFLGDRVGQYRNSPYPTIFQPQAQQQQIRPDGRPGQQLRQTAAHHLRPRLGAHHRVMLDQPDLPGPGNMQPDRGTVSQHQPERQSGRDDTSPRQRHPEYKRQLPDQSEGKNDTDEGNGDSCCRHHDQKQTGRLDIRGDCYRHRNGGSGKAKPGFLSKAGPGLYLAEHQSAVGAAESE